MIKFYPRNPVKSFQDLEIYQKLLASCVEIVKEIQNTKPEGLISELICTPLTNYVINLPKQIAKAHSIRFPDYPLAEKTLEDAMLNCNLTVVHLELYRDLIKTEKTVDFFNEHIKNYLTTRMKIMHLQKSWKKFNTEK